MSAPQLFLLILEDDPAHTEAIRLAFESADPGVKIRLASSLRDYCEQVADCPPDILLMDLNLPDGNAQEALSLLSENNPFPVLVMTSMGNEEVAVAAMKAGALDYVVKSPQAFADMPRCVRRVLREWDLLQDRKRVSEELKRSEACFRGFFNLALHGRCITSREKGWMEVNDKLCAILGYSREELFGMTWTQITHPEDLAADVAQFARILSGEIEQYKLEKRFFRKDGSIVWTEISVGCVRKSDGSVDILICVMDDITERKAMEDMLKNALVAANAASAAKSDFLGLMSHELRTPLNGVLGFAELLAASHLDEEQKKYAQTITKSGEHLLSVVNDILDFSSMESGKLSIHAAPFAFAELVEQSVVAARKAAADKGLEFRCEVAADVPARITGDDYRIRQILINLLGNAVKFTPNGSVDLRIAPATEGRFLEFSVIDTGIGISSGTMACLFQVFTQGDARVIRRFGGTGLGLAISKRLAEAMGGSISVASIPEKGSTFTFRLPLDVSDGSVSPVPPHLPIGADWASPSSQSAELAVPQDAPLVLVVDDDQVSSILAGKMLQSLGYRAEFATSGDKALKAFVPGKFAAILMDMSMPVMDGVEATAKIREIEEPSGCYVPIIALTANVMPSDIKRCLSAGMDDVLTKPYKRAEFAAKLSCATKGGILVKEQNTQSRDSSLETSSHPHSP